MRLSQRQYFTDEDIRELPDEILRRKNEINTWIGRIRSVSVDMREPVENECLADLEEISEKLKKFSSTLSGIKHMMESRERRLRKGGY